MLELHAILWLALAITTALAVWAGWREWRALRREDRLRHAEHLLAAPMSGAAAEGAAIGAGALAASLYDLYAAAADHAAVLDELQRRYHLAVPPGASPLDWLAFFQGKFGDEAEVQGVVSTMVGGGEIPDELYAQLAQSGELAELKAQGFDILDGQLSHGAHEAAAHAAVDALEAGGDVAQHIPMVGLAVFGARTVANVVRYARGRATAAETGVDLAGDAARIGASVAIGVGAAKVGAILGTLVAPGVGTVVGAGVGAVVAGIASSRALSWAKDTVKYGAILAAVRTIGASISAKISQSALWDEVHEAICDEVYRRDALYDARSEEERLAAAYEPETRLYSGPYRRPTPMGTLTRLHAANLARLERRMAIAARNVPPRLRELVTDGEHGFLGEVVAANAHVFQAVLGDVEGALTDYQRKIGAFPNHPLRLRNKDGTVIPSTAVFETLCLEELAKAAEAEEPGVVQGRAVNRAVFGAAAACSLAVSGLLFAV